MQGLRNESVKTRSTKVKIHDHAAIDELLDMATTLARDNRRLLFFCSCKAGRLRACHRFQITQMLYESSRRFSSPIVVDEWPGGRPSEFELPVSKEVFAKVSHGNLKQVPLGQQVDLQHFAGLAWCSVALLSSAA